MLTLRFIAYSPDRHHIISGYWDSTIHLWDLFSQLFTLLSSGYPTYADFLAQSGAEGWGRDSKNSLLFWAPVDCRTGPHSTALLTFPSASDTRFEVFVFGTTWTKIYNSATPNPFSLLLTKRMDGSPLDSIAVGPQNPAVDKVFPRSQKPGPGANWRAKRR